MYVADSQYSIVSGNVIDIHTGEWIGRMSGLGAGIDSFYEYMLKVSCVYFAIFGRQSCL